MTWTRLSELSGSLPSLPERLRMAIVMNPATTGAAAMPAMKVRVVRCLSSSVRMRRFMTWLLGW